MPQCAGFCLYLQKNDKEMKIHPFTSLCELLRKQDPEVLSIFERYAAKSAPQHRPTMPHLTEMIVATKPIMNKDDAKQRFDDLLARISNCGDNFFAVYEEMSKVLTSDGIGKLLVLLKDNLPEEFLKDDNYKYLFKGMPIFKIKVIDQEWRRTRAMGRYDIKFFHTGTRVDDVEPIKFDTAIAKALFLLFLMMPRTEIKRDEIFEEVKNSSPLRPILYKLITDSFDYDEDHLEGYYNNNSFEDIVKDSKSIANRNIQVALNKRDAEDWYLIDYDRKLKYYSLSLPEEMIDLSQAPSLLEFRDKYLSNIK